MGLTVTTRKGHSVELRQPVTKFVEMINGWNEMQQNSGLCDMRVAHVARNNLPDYVPQDPLRPRTAKRNLREASENLQSELANTASLEPVLKRPRLENPDASVALPLASVQSQTEVVPSSVPEAKQHHEEPTPKPGVSEPPTATVTPALGIVDQRLVSEGLSADVNGSREIEPLSGSVPQQISPSPQASAPTSIAMKRGKAKITVKLQ